MNKNISPQKTTSATIQLLKWAMLFSAICMVVFFDKVLWFSDLGIALPLSMLAENTIGLNALSPLGTLSILSAKAAIIDNNWTVLISGYFMALMGNLVSYMIGKLFPFQPQIKPNPRQLMLSFWHPQLASITAFSAGAARHKFSNYIAWAIPISLLWYTAACYIIANFPLEVRSPWFAYMGIVVLLIWTLKPYILRFLHRDFFGFSKRIP